MKKILLLLAVVALTAACTTQETTEQNQQTMSETNGDVLIHTVFFWMTDDVDDAIREEFKEALDGISEISHVKEGYVGVPAQAERAVVDDSYDFSLTFIFEDREAEEAYQVDPVHEAFVENYSMYWERVVVYDAVTP